MLIVCVCFCQTGTALSKETLKKIALDLNELDKLREEHDLTLKILENKDKQIDYQEHIIDNLKLDVNLLEAKEEQLERYYKEKYTKRFGAALFFGYGYSMSNEKASPILGIGLSYTLFRF